MTKLDELIEAIQNEAAVKRYKKLEKIINNDSQLSKDYQALITTQKQVVNYEHKNDPRLKEAQKDYQIILEQLEQHPLFNEFIELQEWVNNDLKMLQAMIEDALTDITLN
ncbi:MAG: YlbF family regulator [Candidatus Izimaplasma sp.]|nr:YlbF family regulator [Candidatus Izimaplasma bacterium]